LVYSVSFVGYRILGSN